MNLTLDNPYGDISIPRAKLRSYDDSNTIIINPMTLESSYNGNMSQNPYGSFKAQGGDAPSGVPVYGQVKDSNLKGYTIKEDEEQVSRCYACCCRCRRKK
ncbi:hypothetical protein C0J45_20561 [Silurus meridionalis]|uniref:Uncharacterized protein n=1 Tax=Silurus meridionalis TaxID=175797 RepID=A0A8T0AB13_SILME|nr:hypothetical protein HF521_013330 [Silurus meridionalis]KAI5089153.1 hypothetical protein C0J45_20561 [Silurus meridionalis]